MKFRQLENPLQILCFGIIGSTMAFFPGVEPLPTLAAFVGVWLVTLFTARRAPWYSPGVFIALLAAFTLTSAGIVINVCGFTTLSGTATDMPCLMNPDQHRYFFDALQWYGHPDGIEAAAKHRGYGLLIASLWRITGVSIVPPLILNQFATLLALIATGQFAFIISPHKPARAAMLSVIALAAICYWLNHSTLLLRESLATLSFALAALACVAPARLRWRFTALVLAAALLGLLRPQWIYLLSVVPLFMMRERKLRRPVFVIGIASAWILCLTLDSVPEVSSQGLTDSLVSEGDGTRGAYWEMLGDDYFSLPWWKKTLLLPFTAAVQFLTPFPWNYSRDMSYGLTQGYSHVTYPWYLVGGAFLFWLAWGWWKSPAEIRRTGFCGALLWLAVSWLCAGSVSRYALPFLPLIVPVAVFAVTAFRRRRIFLISAITYFLLLAATLVTVYLRFRP